MVQAPDLISSIGEKSIRLLCLFAGSKKSSGTRTIYIHSAN